MATYDGTSGDDIFSFDSPAALNAGDTINGGTGTDTLKLAPTGNYDLSGVTLNSIEILDFLSSSNWTISLTAAQLDYFTSVGATYLRLTTGGAVSMAGVTIPGFGNFTLSNAGNTLDFTGANVLVPGAAMTVTGGNGNDVITTLAGADTIYSGGGDDVINSGGGNDTLDGGLGLDVFHAGAGDDKINAFNSDFVPGETYDGGDGFDWLAVGASTQVTDLTSSTLIGIEKLTAMGGFGSYVLLRLDQLAALNWIGDLNAIPFTLSTGGAITFAGKVVADGTFNLAAADTVFDLTGTLTSVAVKGNSGNDTITGGDGVNALSGGAGNDILSGGGGSDTLTGGVGRDEVYGGAGDDTIIIAAGDVVAGEIYDGGTDNDSVVLAANVDISSATLTGIERVVVNEFGSASMTGAQLQGFSQISSNYFSPENINLTTGGTVSFSGSTDRQAVFNLAATSTVFSVSGLTSTASEAVKVMLNGGSGDDTITGSNYADQFSGGAGLDIFHGGGGDDVIIVRSDDYVGGEVYDGGTGTDALTFSFVGTGSIDISASTISSMEGLTLLVGPTPSILSLTAAQLSGFTSILSYYQSAIFALTTGGNLSFNGKTIAGTFNLAPADTVFDLTGVTLPYGSVTVNGNSGNDTLIGSASADFLTGGDGNDRLDGRAGSDQMTGGLGDDTYILDVSGDRVFENASGGNDTIESSVSVSTINSANVETIRLTGTGNTNATGDGGANVLVGNSGNNILTGGAGNDTLVGYGGADTLRGGADNDTLIVNTGGDGTVIDGGTGTDTLVVTGAVTLGGLVGIEAIDLQSGGALTLSAAQFTTGLAPNAALGGTGALTINMAAGDIALYLQQLTGGSDVTITVNGAADNEQIKGAVNAVNVINGGDGSDSIRGSTRADTLSGGDGNDKLEGGMGADTLTGGAGADTFRYQSASASGLGANADHVTDFVSGTDKLGFLLLDANPGTPAIDPFGYIDTQAFHATGAGEIRYETAGADLMVQVDVNGDGIADMAIYLNGLGGTSLASGDFLI